MTTWRSKQLRVDHEAMTTGSQRVASRLLSNAAMAVIVTAAIVATGCARTIAAPEPAVKPVRAAAVEAIATPRGVRYSANIAPIEQVTAAFKSGGYVDQLLQVRGVDGRLRDVQQGDIVRRGDVLARVNDQDYRARVRQAEAQVAESQATVAKYRLDLERAERLFAAASLTRPDLDAARAAQATGDARVLAAVANVDLAKISLEDTALRSPLPAIVLERKVERGSLAAAGSVGFTVADIRSVKAVFGVPDAVVWRLRPGAPLSITTEAFKGREFNGLVSAISPVANSQTRVFDVEITIANQDSSLRPGMIATVEIEEDPKDRPNSGAPSTPIASIVKDEKSPSGYAVFVIDRAGDKEIARSRHVTLGDVVGNAIQVKEGVQVGERVIVSGAALLKDGEPVRVIP